ncbi:MAG TPA: DNA methyltransferase [Citreicella sp.]|nr:DNA methyltransferase [Citreicella sp.]
MNTLTPVTSAAPVAPWLGGKRNLAKRICAIIDATPCSTYAEPFSGMGGIFLRRKMRPKAEVINDRSRDIANLFRILQRHYPQFLDTLRFQLTTRAEFERLVATEPSTLTDLERAARFLYLQRTAFGGKVSGRNFGVDRDRGARFNLTTIEPMLEDVHTRLAGVVIECLDWRDFLRRYDGEGTLFYLDPPYWGCEDDYGKALFKRSDFDELAEQLASLKGRFVLSLNDVPEVRRIFARFHLTEVTTTYGIANAAGGQGARRELLISSWPLPSGTG